MLSAIPPLAIVLSTIWPLEYPAAMLARVIAAFAAFSGALSDGTCFTSEDVLDSRSSTDALHLLQASSFKLAVPKPEPTANATQAAARIYAFDEFTVSLLQEQPMILKTNSTTVVSAEETIPRNYIPLICLSMLIVAAVSPILIREGVAPFFVVLGYLASLSLVKAFVKQAMNQGFEYSNTITVMHMMATATAAAICDRPLLKEAIPSMPIAVVVGLGIAFNNAALLHTGVAFATMIGTCTPVMTFLVEVMSGRRVEIKAQTVLSLVLVVTGSAMCVQGETSYTMAGLVLISLALLCRSMKTIWQSDLLQIDMPALHLVAWTSVWSVLYLLPVALYEEGVKPWTSLPTLPSNALIPLVLSVIAAASLNILQIVAVKLLGPLLQNLIGNLNLVLVIAIAATTMGEVVTGLQYGGIILMSFGVTLFKAKLDFGTTPAAEKANATPK